MYDVGFVTSDLLFGGGVFVIGLLMFIRLISALTGDRKKERKSEEFDQDCGTNTSETRYKIYHRYLGQKHQIASILNKKHQILSQVSINTPDQLRLEDLDREERKLLDEFLRIIAKDAELYREIVLSLLEEMRICDLYSEEIARQLGVKEIVFTI